MVSQAEPRKEKTMSEKDPFGDKLHEKGRADENLYIAEQERRNLEKMREAKTTTAGDLCPKDGNTLARRKEGGVEVDACPACHGVWLDHDELDVLLRGDEAGVTRWLRTLLKR